MALNSHKFPREFRVFADFFREFVSITSAGECGGGLVRTKVRTYVMGTGTYHHTYRYTGTRNVRRYLTPVRE